MTLPALPLVSTGLGLLMAATAATGSRGIALITAATAALAVLFGLIFRVAATLAVLLAGAAIAFAGTPPLPVAISGLSAALYLAARHTPVLTAATLIGAAGFVFAGLVATVFPLRMPWAPLLAPLAAFGCYVLAVRPFLGERDSVATVRPRPRR